MSRNPVTPEVARALARAKYDRHAGTWAAREAAAVVAAAADAVSPAAVGPLDGLPDPEDPLVSTPLHPPTERAALADEAAAIAWVRSWSGAGPDLGSVRWAERRWASLGTQQVPERLVWHHAADVARAAGRSGRYARITARFAELLRAVPGDRASLAEALPGAAAAVEGLDDDDFGRLIGVLTWLAGHPESAMYIRQLPIRGVDSKWVSTHRALVRRLHAAASGREGLGLASPPELIRLRFLDPALAPDGLTDLSAPLADLAGLQVSPRTVFVVENLETILAVPALEGAVVVHGRGYAVDAMARIPWVTAADVVYWGDLDSHGFAILHRLRAHGVPARSVLMDVPTLDAFADLCVPEPRPSTGRLGLLTAAEEEALQALAGRGHVRLEQERIDWAHAVAVLTRAAQERP